MNSWKLDCRYFLGDRPCKFKRTCPGCAKYSPMGKRILIVKLAAIGDVLRTTPLLSGLKRAYPQSHITWVVDKEAYPLLKNIPIIDRLLTFDYSSLLPLEAETFDLIIGLEKEPRGAALVSKFRGREKKGFGLGPKGNVFPLNQASEYAFLLGLSDELKFYQNQKTYPELIFGITELDFQKDEYFLVLLEEDTAFAERFARRIGLKKGEIVIGLNTGAGDVFANKAWTLEGYIQLINGLRKDPKTSLLLLGGPKEKERNSKILKEAKGGVIDSGCDNTLREFAALIDLCDVVVTGDTTALHMAIALKKKVVAFFGPTCAQEIELYGRGEKIISSLPCAPCYRRSCQVSPNCMQAIEAKEVMEKIRALLPRSQKKRGI
ncbi:MAG: glycosyltransferase family 9 protein [Thermodesulfobacteriota bacterium]|nr:glycosyltransferase family 9 protein [Thermodesulfobacteriota bacterium]